MRKMYKVKQEFHNDHIKKMGFIERIFKDFLIKRSFKKDYKEIGWKIPRIHLSRDRGDDTLDITVTGYVDECLLKERLKLYFERLS